VSERLRRGRNLTRPSRGGAVWNPGTRAALRTGPADQAVRRSSFRGLLQARLGLSRLLVLPGVLRPSPSG
jgi:hypothetical protein